MKWVIFVFLLCSALALPSVTALSVELVKTPIAGRAYTPECLGICDMVLNVSLDSPLSTTKTNFKDYLDLNVPDWELWVLENRTYTTYTENCNDKAVNTNGTPATVKDCVKTPIQKWAYEWVKFDGNYNFKAGRVILDFRAYRTPKIGKNANNIDAIPKVVTPLPQFAWWNSSWTRKYDIYVNNTDGNYHLNENMTVNITITDSGNCVNEIRAVYNKSGLETDNFDVVASPDEPYCFVRFLINASASTQYPNSPFITLYYNNTGASEPSRTPVLLWKTEFSDTTFLHTEKGSCDIADGYLKLGGGDNRCHFPENGNSSWGLPITVYTRTNYTTFGTAGIVWIAEGNAGEDLSAVNSTGVGDWDTGNANTFDIGAWKPQSIVDMDTISILPKVFHRILIHINLSSGANGKVMNDSNQGYGDVTKSWVWFYNPKVCYQTNSMWADYLYVFKGLVNIYQAPSAPYLSGSELDITPPIIDIVAPENKTYCNCSLIWLNITVNEAVGGSCVFHINNTANQTINMTTGNTYLNCAFPVGTHNITVYCNDTAGNWGKNTTQFTYSLCINGTASNATTSNVTVTINLPISEYTDRYCITNNTLMILYNYSYNGQTITLTNNKNCPYGCDNVTYSCNMNTFEMNMWFGLVAIGLIIAIGVIIRLWGRR